MPPAAGKKRRTRRVKGLPGVRLPLPKKPHQRHEDRRRRPPRHRPRFDGSGGDE